MSALAASSAATGVSSAATKVINLTLTSSPLCPFCFVRSSSSGALIAALEGAPKLTFLPPLMSVAAVQIGLRNIQKAQAALPDVTFRIQFQPFLLDPTLTSTPVNKRARYEAKFGGAEKVAAMERVMKEKALACGIQLSYGGTMSQPTDALRLSALAWEMGGQERQLDLMERLFKGYFEQENDLGDRSFLVAQALDANLFSSSTEAEAFLTSTAFSAEIEAGYRKAAALGISGVPFTVINDKYAVEGAQPAEAFAEIFAKVADGVAPA